MLPLLLLFLICAPDLFFSMITNDPLNNNPFRIISQFVGGDCTLLFYSKRQKKVVIARSPPQADDAAIPCFTSFAMTFSLDVNSFKPFTINAQGFRGIGRKVPLLAIIRHRASLTLGRGFAPFMPRTSFFFRRPLRKSTLGDQERNLPPMLAAQASFPSVPLRRSQGKIDQRIGR